jgi:hypothetical protein
LWPPATGGAQTVVENIRAFGGDLGLLPAEFLLTPTLEIDAFVAQYVH